MALLEKAAGQGHAYAKNWLGMLYHGWKEHEHAVEWFTKGAEAGLPTAMFNAGTSLDEGRGVAAPDYPAALDWYRRAASDGNGEAAVNLCWPRWGLADNACHGIPPHFRPLFLELNSIT